MYKRQDEVLLLKMPPTSARYQAIQLADMWFASLEYADCITSLNDAQSIVAADGNTYYVISATDPGYPNWLDAEGGKRGVFLCLLYTSPSPRDRTRYRMPSSA